MKRILDIIIEPKTTHNIKGNINDNIITYDNPYLRYNHQNNKHKNINDKRKILYITYIQKNNNT